jgi:hypothetical protein
VTFCNFTESNFNVVNVHTTLFNEYGLYRPLRSQSKSHFLVSLCRCFEEIRPILTPCITPCIEDIYSYVLLSRPGSKLEDHPLSAVHDYLFSTFAGTLYILRPSDASATKRRDVCSDIDSRNMKCNVVLLKPDA